MSASTYLELPVEALHNLLVVSVKDMVGACDSTTPEALLAFRSAKKQVEILMDVIEERKVMDEEERKSKNR